jgi:hypothetical protein
MTVTVLQKKILSTQIAGTGIVNISSKGLVNGLSEYFNDGAQFGPDTLGTQSTGLLEAWEYAYHNNLEIVLVGDISINKNITLSATLNGNGSFSIRGASKEGCGITVNTSSGYGITVDATVLKSGNIALTDLYFVNGGSADGAFYCDESINDAGQDVFQFSNINLGTSNDWGSYPIYINGFQTIIGDVLQNYTNNPVYFDALYILLSNCNGAHGLDIGYFDGGAFVSMSNVQMEGVLKTHSQINILNISGIWLETTFSIGGDISVFIITGLYLSSFAGGGYILNASAAYTISHFHVIGLGGQLFNNTTVYNSTYLTVNDLKVENIDIDLNGYTFTNQFNAPTISTNPPVSGTVYQNTNNYPIEIDMPVYATTSGTAGYVTIVKGPSTGNLTGIASQYVSGDTTSTATQIITLRVPTGWYYKFVSSGVTFGTASVFAD